MSPAGEILARLRPLFEERQREWEESGEAPPEEIMLCGWFPVAALRAVLAPRADVALERLYNDIDHHLTQILDLLKPGGKS